MQHSHQYISMGASWQHLFIFLRSLLSVFHVGSYWLEGNKRDGREKHTKYFKGLKL